MWVVDFENIVIVLLEIYLYSVVFVIGWGSEVCVIYFIVVLSVGIDVVVVLIVLAVVVLLEIVCLFIKVIGVDNIVDYVVGVE